MTGYIPKQMQVLYTLHNWEELNNPDFFMQDYERERQYIMSKWNDEDEKAMIDNLINAAPAASVRPQGHRC
jgi:hypothetical protein